MLPQKKCILAVVVWLLMGGIWNAHSAAGAPVYYKYTEGKLSQKFSYSINQTNDGYEIRYQSASVQSICHTDQNYNTTRWEYNNIVNKTVVTGVRESGEIRLNGKMNDASFTREYTAGSSPWYQCLDISLEYFAKSKFKKIIFYFIEPEKMENLEMNATSLSSEKITVAGKTLDTKHIEIRLTGFKSIFWKGDYWFRLTDFSFVRYSTGDSGNNPILIELLSQAKTWDKIHTSVDIVENTARAENKKEEKANRGFLPIALPYYMPETSLALAVVGLFFYSDENSATVAKPNEYSIMGTITLNKQYSIASDITQYFHQDNFKLSNYISYSHFPDIHWGAGPDTPETAAEAFTSNIFEIKTAFTFKLNKGIFLGPRYRLLYENVQEFVSGGILDQGLVPNAKGSTSSGIGFQFSIDTTDNTFYPHSGIFLNLVNTNNFPFLGSTNTYSDLIIDFRYYLQLYKEHVLAFQGYSFFTIGDTPYQAMPKLGGDMIMRGYYTGRYRDKIYTAVQAEYRFPIYWIFGGTLFAGMGEVAPEFMKFSLKNSEFAFGLGIRATVMKADHINIRLDLGFDKSFNPNFYLMLKEAF